MNIWGELVADTKAQPLRKILPRTIAASALCPATFALITFQSADDGKDLGRYWVYREIAHVLFRRQLPRPSRKGIHALTAVMRHSLDVCLRPSADSKRYCKKFSRSIPNY